MKVNDTVDVRIGNHVVAQATVKELGDGTATLIVPATLVVMGTRTDLTDLPENNVTTGTEHQILGVESDGKPAAPVDEKTQTTNTPQNTDTSQTSDVSTSAEVSTESVDPAELSNVESTKPESSKDATSQDS